MAAPLARSSAGCATLRFASASPKRELLGSVASLKLRKVRKNSSSFRFGEAFASAPPKRAVRQSRKAEKRFGKAEKRKSGSVRQSRIAEKRRTKRMAAPLRYAALCISFFASASPKRELLGSFASLKLRKVRKNSLPKRMAATLRFASALPKRELLGSFASLKLRKVRKNSLPKRMAAPLRYAALRCATLRYAALRCATLRFASALPKRMAAPLRYAALRCALHQLCQSEWPLRCATLRFASALPKRELLGSFASLKLRKVRKNSLPKRMAAPLRYAALCISFAEANGRSAALRYARAASLVRIRRRHVLAQESTMILNLAGRQTRKL
uniref:Uncharacterized protein n=1 Tax=Hydrodictyon reticulatum TaxID=3107 RepID=A0A1W5RNX0_HYDRE|nr:hypothetical protein [Hydrodictyon reticulatum]YP_009364242.1 hypothetical protein [Hydrodictyon reticulatum]AQU64526.1 hypothetical protein [Hydrodictyon reticulatum]AQU64527.1 hypothetical protein [Hydrodictyon reticulatum]